ncbi:MAG: Fe-S cluster assembly protein SufD [Candidatus Latescibacteria bacterium]|nr:Fe-S cluster assembly protein SufD [Candidatus Latescibacterota bacterium]NIM21743.1 Fe-S cluster assembly protein SufD [Candidatus Latescibacterota bacterium]NIM65881.1 Fe-S cluster assembly protein SufD [Candidatus Latescibacterota bacterium]NIO02626.1 Fe-S cluster assembly protein SufD [Candidatus Latescibacterota bacterium]NIO29607.1 Fe-S cluster assembly protein SufD [Candidatus Latescibacterota bacterium]
MNEIDRYLISYENFQKTRSEKEPSWIRRIRKDAIERFAHLGFPGPRQEDWRFTRVKPITRTSFERVDGLRSNGLSSGEIARRTFNDAGCHRLAFVDGHYCAELSSQVGSNSGLVIESLADALQRRAALVENHLARYARFEEQAFIALNTAFISDGAFVYVPEDATVVEPIHLVFASSGLPSSTPAIGSATSNLHVDKAGPDAPSTNGNAPRTHPRILIIGEKGSRATIIESYIGLKQDAYFTNPVTEIILGENADVSHYKLQRESDAAYHVAALQANIEKDARFSSASISIGGALVRNDVNVILDGEGVSCALDGLYLGDNRQHVDNHTFIKHAKPNCESFELYKGILDGRSSGVFNGRIYVDPGAQKTDAKQTNNCLLLSDDARINTSPQLEIFADDVKCTHGATVGQLDEAAIFYLRSRGIEENDARHMLIYAFANEVLDRIHLAPVRDRFATDLFEWLSK